MTKDKNNRDILYGEFVNQIHGTKDDLRKLIDDCVKKAELKSELEHYTTKHKVLSLAGILIVAICSAYWLLTPVVIKSEIITLETKIDELLNIIKFKNQQ